MRQLVLQMGISLDGYVVGPNGQTDWGVAPEDPELKRRKLEWLERVGAHLMGRVTYEEMASYWPSSASDYAAPMNEIPKVVFSKTLAEANWPDSQIARGDLAEEIARLKGESGRELIAWGGGTFAQGLAREGLIDEYRLIVHPVALGGGVPLFKDLAAPLHLDLAETMRFPTGRVVHLYRKA
jgi:dihydrofolate reductase